MRRLDATLTAVACGLLLQIVGLMPASAAPAAANSCGTAGCPAPAPCNTAVCYVDVEHERMAAHLCAAVSLA